jgi:cytochrome c oxidase subunit 2
MRRIVTFGSMAVVALFALAACGDDTSRYSTLSPRSDVADDIQGIYKLVFWLALLVFIGVQFAIVYTALRYRRRKEGEVRPPQIHGNKTLEIVWTIIPAIVLLVIFIPTVRIMYDQADSAESGDYVVEVYAKQWWWEVHYPGLGTSTDNVTGEQNILLTANEIHVPVDKKIQIKLYSNNVIHSFYVPQLSGKMDVIPGHENVIGFTASEPGVYYGECAEFCGDAHAWMRFQVVVQPQEQFDAWVTAMNTPSPSAAATYGTNPDGTLVQAPAAMGICLGCHRVGGTTAAFAPIGLDEDPGTEEQLGTAKIAGPDLGLFGCRTTIGAGIIPNTVEDLEAWLRDPGAIKPGTYMGTAIKPGTLKEEDIHTIAVFLESLVPEGGCITVTNAADPINNSLPTGNDSLLAATPEASATPGS